MPADSTPRRMLFLNHNAAPRMLYCFRLYNLVLGGLSGHG
jgi:hypothetical protein